MTLFSLPTDPPLQQVYVALDLEMTGLDPASDEIIEMGAVRFRGREVLDTFTSAVNPHRRLTDFIRGLTGISQEEVDGAPPFAQVAPRFVSFVGDAPVVGQNVSFDLAFLGRQGVRFSGPVFDTRELAQMLLPSAEYSLAALARFLGVEPWRAHRALDDAVATSRVLTALVERALALDPDLAAELARLTQAAGMPLHQLLGGVTAAQEAEGRRGTLGPGGLDLKALEERLRAERGSRRALARARPEPILADEVAALVQPGSALTRAIPEYEHRPEQEEMLRAVTEALNEGEHLLVEAGTGVGKSIAYLLPAALYAMKNGARVVVSTNTINLQEQLVSKDIPAVARVLGDAAGPLRATTLKGRANYLCVRRWARLRSSAGLSGEEAKLLGKLACWLPETTTGDRSELNMGRPDHGVWDRLSAQGSPDCPASEGPCFLRAARERAEAAHIVVVNHALLLSDLERGGGLLPAHDRLIVDEAHHLEAEATRQFGARMSYEQLQEALTALGGPRGLSAEALDAYRTSRADASRRETTSRAVETLEEALGRARFRVDALFEAVGRFLREQSDGGDGDRAQLLVTSGVRTQPGWSDLEIAWDGAASTLGEVARRVSGLRQSLDGLEDLGLLNYEALRSELSGRESAVEDTRALGDAFLLRPSDETIYWFESSPGGSIALQSAPLHVGELLRKRLFDTKASVVLTSATLAVAGDFGPVRDRLGLEDPRTLLLGSPFDYQQAAMVCVPHDMPEPGVAGYASSLARTVGEVARAAEGRTMVLFTSHAALRTAASALRSPLDSAGIKLLAQGVDGTPRQLMERFLEDPRAVLLGTASFWEGVDLAGEALSVLVLARLPFDVPTDPVFSARSALYDNAFREYSVPQAVLRFRQGFGRLIRRGTDRGAVVVLDRRTTARSYGGLFLRALPPCPVERPSLAELPDLVARWLDVGEGSRGDA